MSETSLPAGYSTLLKEIKDRITQAQARAVHSVNAELVRHYWDIGRITDAVRRKKAGVLP
jgi:hypothetical protein